MIDPGHKLPLVRQAKLLDLSRSSVYYLPQPTSESAWTARAAVAIRCS